MSHSLTPFSGHERRITLRLLSYWEKIRRDRAMPSESDIVAAEIADLWEHCFLVHVADIHKAGHHFAYLGEAIRRAYAGALSDVEASRLISPNVERLADCYMEIIHTQKPVVDEGEFRNHSGELVKYRQCLLPLGEAGEVQAIFGGMRYKLFPSA